jgi:hypothetical protein
LFDLFTIPIQSVVDLFYSIFGLELYTYLPLFGVVSVGSALILTLAYHNIAHWLKTR